MPYLDPLGNEIPDPNTGGGEFLTEKGFPLGGPADRAEKRKGTTPGKQKPWYQRTLSRMGVPSDMEEWDQFLNAPVPMETSQTGTPSFPMFDPMITGIVPGLIEQGGRHLDQFGQADALVRRGDVIGGLGHAAAGLVPGGPDFAEGDAASGFGSVINTALGAYGTLRKPPMTTNGIPPMSPKMPIYGPPVEAPPGLTRQAIGWLGQKIPGVENWSKKPGEIRPFIGYQDMRKPARYQQTNGGIEAPTSRQRVAGPEYDPDFPVIESIPAGDKISPALDISNTMDITPAPAPKSSFSFANPTVDLPTEQRIIGGSAPVNGPDQVGAAQNWASIAGKETFPGEPQSFMEWVNSQQQVPVNATVGDSPLPQPFINHPTYLPETTQTGIRRSAAETGIGKVPPSKVKPSETFEVDTALGRNPNERPAPLRMETIAEIRKGESEVAAALKREAQKELISAKLEAKLAEIDARSKAKIAEFENKARAGGNVSLGNSVEEIQANTARLLKGAPVDKPVVAGPPARKSGGKATSKKK